MKIIKNLLIIIFIILISTFILIFLNKEFKNNYSDWRVVYTKSFLNDSYNLVIYAEDNGRKDFSHSSLEPNINYDDKQNIHVTLTHDNKQIDSLDFSINTNNQAVNINNFEVSLNNDSIEIVAISKTWRGKDYKDTYSILLNSQYTQNVL